MEGWAPFAEGRNELFQNETLTTLGKKYDKSVAQVVLRWLIQRGIVCIPKSANVERMKQNLEVFDFELSESDMNEISQLETGKSSFFNHRDAAATERILGMVRNT